MKTSLRPLDVKQLRVAARELAARDKDLGGIYDQFGPPPLWGRPSSFETMTRIILEQQVSLASARSSYERLRALAGPLNAASIGRLSTRQIQSCGVTRQKTRYIEGLALAVHEKRLSFRSLRSMTNEEARDHLLQLPGIGPWTADIYLLMALKRPDVWPVGDIALENTLKRLKPRLKQSSVDYAKRYWKPWRSVAARFLWHDYLCRRRSKS